MMKMIIITNSEQYLPVILIMMMIIITHSKQYLPKVFRMVALKGGVFGAQDDEMAVHVLRGLQMVHQVLKDTHEAVGVLPEHLGMV